MPVVSVPLTTELPLAASYTVKPKALPGLSLLIRSAAVAVPQKVCGEVNEGVAVEAVTATANLEELSQPLTVCEA